MQKNIAGLPGTCGINSAIEACSVVKPSQKNQNPPKPFYPVSQHYIKKLGVRAQKIPVTIASSCPNREGIRGMQTCVFCDVWGSSAFPEIQNLGLREQIEKKLGTLGANYGAKDFLIYFQAYTSTFLGVKKIREYFDIALSFPQVRGLVVGTRPDCLSPAVFELWREYSKKTFISVELGVQSFSDHHLEFLRRGHSGQASIDAIHKIKAETDVDLGIHLIFGHPGETDAEIIETGRICSSLPLDHVKLHNLHVLKNTGLEEIHARGEFTPVELPEYARRVTLFLQNLAPHIAIQRLAALSSHWEELVAPEWTRHKNKSNQFILDYMLKAGAKQGQLVI